VVRAAVSVELDRCRRLAYTASRPAKLPVNENTNRKDDDARMVTV